MKKNLFLSVTLLTAILLSANAKADVGYLVVGGLDVSVEYTIDKNTNQYLVRGKAYVPGFEGLCEAVGSLAYYGNYIPDQINKTCGDYIIRLDTIQEKVEHPVQGVSFQLSVQVDFRDQVELKTLGKKAVELRFVEAQMIEAPKSKNIDKK